MARSAPTPHLPFAPARIPGQRPPRRPIRWACTTDAVTCRRCNTVWEEGDPAYQIACRGCGAPKGMPCRRPAGGNERVCPERDIDTTRAGLLQRCDGLSWDGRHDKPLALRAQRLPRSLQVMSGSPVSRDLL